MDSRASVLVPRDGNPARRRGAECNPSLTYRVMVGSLPIVLEHLCRLRST